MRTQQLGLPVDTIGTPAEKVLLPDASFDMVLSMYTSCALSGNQIAALRVPNRINRSAHGLSLLNGSSSL